MKTCSIKQNVIYNSIKASGVKDSTKLRNSLKSSSDIIKALKTKDFLHGIPEANDIQQDHNKVVEALKNVPKFEEFGLYITEDSNAISNEGKKFISNLLTDQEESLGFINTLSPSGYIGENNATIYKEGTSYRSDLTAKELNSRINNYFNQGQEGKVDTVFVTKTNKGVIVSPEFRTAHNNRLYSRYLGKIGGIAKEAFESRIKVSKNKPVVNTEIPKGVHTVYSDSSGLSKIGTLRQYVNYLNGIFPFSEFKQVVWHSTVRPFDVFDQSKTTMASKDGGPGIYFADEANKDEWVQYQEQSGAKLRNPDLFLDKGVSMPMILNSKKVQVVRELYYAFSPHEGYTEYRYEPEGEVDTVIEGSLSNIKQGVFKNPTEIHILGNEQDKKKFKEYVDLNYNTEEELEYVNEIDTAIVELSGEPASAHIKLRINTLNTEKKLTSRSGNTTRTAEIEREIINLQSTKRNMKVNTSKADVLDYFYEVLSNVSADLGDPNISMEAISTHIKSLDLIINAGDANPTVNRTLNKKDLLDADFKGLVQEAATKAQNLHVLVMERAYEKAMEVIRASSDKTLTDEEIMSFNNMREDVDKLAQSVLGLHAIGNPAIQHIYKKTESALIRANKLVETFNDEIAELYDDMIAAGTSTKDFIQKNEKGRISGFMVDALSSKWWKTKATIYKNYKERQEKTVPLNPAILFETEKDNKQRKILEDTLKDWLGPYMYGKYINEAKRLWDSYKSIEEIFIKTNPTVAELADWRRDNSPIERINNYNHRIVTKDKFKRDQIAGTDEFLLLVPRKTDSSGTDLGFYDESYKKIEGNKKAMAFYKMTRDNFIKNEFISNRYTSLFKPPSLGYIGRGIAEELKNENYGSAFSLFKKMLKGKLTTSLYRRAVSINKITGKQELQLVSQLHSIPDEINYRVQAILRDDEYYQELDKKNKADRVKRRKIREDVVDRVSQEVEEQRSEDLLQSITLSNFAASNLIEKAKIETELNIIQHLFESEKMQYPSKDFDILKTSEHIIKNSLTHYMGVRFYDQENKQDTSFFGEAEKEKADRLARGETVEEGPTRGMSVRSGTSTALSVARVIYLGWSVPSSLTNGVMGIFAGVRKAWQRDDLSLGSLITSYGDILQKKNRNIVDKLYILGDVAFSYDRHTIQARGFYAKLSKYGNPMVLQTATEKFVQGGMAISIMKNEVVRNTKTGEVSSIYDAVDEKGIMSDDWYSDEYKTQGEEVLIELTVSKIRPVNMQTSGDYLSPLLAEQRELGKFLTMFKKFITEQVRDRVGRRRYDYVQKKEEMGSIRGAIKVLSNTWNGTESDRVEKVAAKGLIADFVLWFAMRVLTTGATELLCDTKECKDQKGYILYTLNTFGRMTDELWGFLTLGHLYKSVVTPFAIEGLFDDFYETGESILQYLVPGGEDGLYKTDTDFYEKGDPKYLRKIQGFIPVWRTNVVRTQQLSNKLYKGSFINAIEPTTTKKKIMY